MRQLQFVAHGDLSDAIERHNDAVAQTLSKTRLVGLRSRHRLNLPRKCNRHGHV